ncbi:MAG: hypothetical protein ABF702_09295, partial [Lacticaseibacillus paracasei]
PKPTITPKDAYAPVSTRAGSRFVITRLPAQKPAHKSRGRNGQKPTITSKATYAPVSTRAGSRSRKNRRSQNRRFL